MSQRLALPARRQHITQKLRIAGQRTLYLSFHDENDPRKCMTCIFEGRSAIGPREGEADG